jgi:coenzyme F420-reducing hydrogenase alpha subunit
MKVKVEEPINIEVEHIARVEGHGNIQISIENGELVNCSWDVVETPRFFEVMFRGLSIEMAPLLASRICGICSISHALASARAAERALQIRVPKIAQNVRLLAKHAETLQSHTLHLFFLVAPDLLDVGSVIPVLKSHPEIIQMATQLKGYANQASDLFAGRTSHPMAIQVGGVTQVPRKSQLWSLLQDLESIMPTLWKALDIFKTLPFPDFERETEFVSLRGEGHYPFIGGDLISSDGVHKEEDAYLAMTNEYLVDTSTSKLCKLSRESFAVGALARFNNNSAWLHPQAKVVADELGCCR